MSTSFLKTSCCSFLLSNYRTNVADKRVALIYRDRNNSGLFPGQESNILSFGKYFRSSFYGIGKCYLETRHVHLI